MISDATVSEQTFGAPPFALFLSASGHVSGRAGYPSVDAAGTVLKVWRKVSVTGHAADVMKAAQGLKLGSSLSQVERSISSLPAMR